MNTAKLSSGELSYSESGAGQPIVFLHGLLQDGRLWSPLIEDLSRDFRCITPTLPLGAHRSALHPKADTSIAGVAQIVAELLAQLGLHDVTLVGNDTGGAIAQFVAARHPDRLGRLVLTGCEAFENYLPQGFRMLPPAARAGLLTPILSLLRLRSPRRLPNGYGWLTRGPLPHTLIDEWVAAYFASPGVRRDTRTFTLSLGKRTQMIDIAAELKQFHKPALIAWATDDKLFPAKHATRLAEALPQSQLEFIDGSLTWVMRDQPQRTIELLRAFVAATTTSSAY